MAAPNIVNVASIIGVSTFISGISTTGSVIISNAASSNQVYKINTLLAAGIGATTAITVKIHSAAAGAGTSVSIASTIDLNFAGTTTSLFCVGSIFFVKFEIRISKSETNSKY